MAKIGAYGAIVVGFAGAVLILVGGGLLGALFGLLTLSDPVETLKVYPLGWLGAVAVAFATGIAGIVALKRPVPGGWLAIALAVVGVVFGGPVIRVVCLVGAVAGILCIAGARARKT